MDKLANKTTFKVPTSQMTTIELEVWWLTPKEAINLYFDILDYYHEKQAAHDSVQGKI